MNNSKVTRIPYEKFRIQTRSLPLACLARKIDEAADERGHSENIVPEDVFQLALQRKCKFCSRGNSSEQHTCYFQQSSTMELDETDDSLGHFGNVALCFTIQKDRVTRGREVP